jgi:hypothetical protein
VSVESWLLVVFIAILVMYVALTCIVAMRMTMAAAVENLEPGGDTVKLRAVLGGMTVALAAGRRGEADWSVCYVMWGQVVSGLTEEQAREELRKFNGGRVREDWDGIFPGRGRP